MNMKHDGCHCRDERPVELPGIGWIPARTALTDLECGPEERSATAHFSVGRREEPDDLGVGDVATLTVRGPLDDVTAFLTSGALRFSWFRVVARSEHALDEYDVEVVLAEGSGGDVVVETLVTRRDPHAETTAETTADDSVLTYEIDIVPAGQRVLCTLEVAATLEQPDDEDATVTVSDVRQTMVDASGQLRMVGAVVAGTAADGVVKQTSTNVWTAKSGTLCVDVITAQSSVSCQPGGVVRDDYGNGQSFKNIGESRTTVKYWSGAAKLIQYLVKSSRSL